MFLETPVSAHGTASDQNEERIPDERVYHM